ncbi:MAG: protein-methionine-sulfoxide reductase heme-binding subunit MsrQ [Confluentimicrobium sp.]|uniref:protein-methionine-sulfoxide reductase heme-binding subunit MsrQ n=1 Tax=Actibacterium sp. TaxID=1872125 RepID=UPI000C48E8FF|nr:protein-methionine-sulfoxide reductase heme-binding subunit MsrQ [Actibacterium sp.]MBC55459.1 protein-methionine-sulfoxide reductase heme-binding subunit MsrQ [Actibacterium sp.]
MSVERVNTALRRVPAWVLYIVGPLPALWFLWLGLTGGLGVEPIRGLEHELGQFALKLMIAGLAITPLRRLAGLNLIRYRRAIGLLAFFYVLLHLAVWLFLDLQSWGLIRADILKRPYITIGMLAFVLMIPLALTSNNRSVRKLGPSWRRLHRLTYPAVLLGAIHFVMLVKGWQAEPLVYLAVILGLLALRLRRAPRRAAA